MQCACRMQLQPHNLPKLNIAKENQGTRCLVLSRVCLRTPRVEELGSSGWGKWQYAHRSSLWQPSVDACNTHASQVPSACAAWSASAGWGQLQANANFILCHLSPGLKEVSTSQDFSPVFATWNWKRLSLRNRRNAAMKCTLTKPTVCQKHWAWKVFLESHTCLRKFQFWRGSQHAITYMIWYLQMQCPAVRFFPGWRHPTPGFPKSWGGSQHVVTQTTKWIDPEFWEHTSKVTSLIWKVHLFNSAEVVIVWLDGLVTSNCCMWTWHHLHPRLQSHPNLPGNGAVLLLPLEENLLHLPWLKL